MQHKKTSTGKNRSHPTMREVLRWSRRGGKFRPPWYSGYPGRNQTSRAHALKRR